jgi:hypothetical protein
MVSTTLHRAEPRPADAQIFRMAVAGRLSIGGHEPMTHVTRPLIRLEWSLRGGRQCDWPDLVPTKSGNGLSTATIVAQGRATNQGDCTRDSAAPQRTGLGTVAHGSSICELSAERTDTFAQFLSLPKCFCRDLASANEV